MLFCFLCNCFGIFLSEHPGYRHWNHSLDDDYPNNHQFLPTRSVDYNDGDDFHNANVNNANKGGTNAKAPYKDDANTNHYNAKPNSMRNAKNNANPTIMNC